MSNQKTKGTLQKKKIADKTILMEKIAKKNIQIMHLEIKILPTELTMDRNFKNYLHKFGAYLFTIGQMKCKILH